MAHGGLTVEELFRQGRAVPGAVAHAQEEFGGGGSEADGIDVTNMTPLEYLACLADSDCVERMEEFEEDLLSDSAAATAPEDTFTRTDRDTTTETDAITRTLVEDITQTQTQVFFSLPTAEQFLNDFENSFAGFAANAAAAGLGSGDVNQMLDPNSGFMRKLLTEYIGEIAQRALDGEDPLEFQGQDNQEGVPLGDRPGVTTITDTDRDTTVDSTQDTVSRTDESRSVQETSGDDPQSVQQDSVLDEHTADTVHSQSDTDVHAEEHVTEELIQRDLIAPVNKFTPTDFFLNKFASEGAGEDEAAVTERFLGSLSTEIRTSAPRIRPRGGTPTSVSARRV